ncbi:TniQ family protein [Pseudomonas viridiflava]|uniref:TniQ family protein n=1 Tax=Pseudomonas viridiflava TaxID=33069 RepID=UPI001253920D|nr:TniQ family protein [Pseudomonas viridiflava]VVM48496.1 hypothetical protein PS634_00666 [Pseudomonas fluorescens]
MYNLLRDDIDLGSLGLFPKGEPDETFRSIIARYSILNSIRSQSTLLRTIFRRGCRNEVIYNEDLRVLSLLVANKKGAEDFYSKILNENTFTSLILNFAKKNTSDSLIRRVDKIDDNYLLDRKYCILCVARDYDSKGFTYWRRSHQIPGVVCCWEHFTHLYYIPNARNSMLVSRSLLNVKAARILRDPSAQKIASKDDIQFSIFARDALSMKRVASNKNKQEKMLYLRNCVSVSKFARNYFKRYPDSSRNYRCDEEEMMGRLFTAYKVFDSVNNMVSSVMTR